MWILVDKDVDEVLMDLDLYDHPIVKVLGERNVEYFVERRFFGSHESDIAAMFEGENSQIEFIACLAKRRNKPLTADEIKTLGVSVADLKAEGVPMEDPTIKVIIESEAQMKLFPEMEVNLPPYRIVVKIEEGK